MKPSYIKTLLLSGIVAGTTACTDLDTKMVGNYTEFPDNPIAVSGEFEGCYFYHRNEAWFGRNFWEGMFLCGDEAVGINLAGVYYEMGRYHTASVHNFSSDRPSVGLMGDMLQGITYTNQRILLYGGAEGKDAIVAPLRAIRAYYHFWLMEMYGDVPLMDHCFNEDEVIDRAPRADVARFIEQELLEVIPQLSEANDISTYGRPNKWMAEALLVKLYLNWGVYTHDIYTVDNNTPNEKLDDCVYWCDQITESGIFEVGQGYRRKFFPDNGVHIKDFIYACPFDPATLGGNQYWAGHELARFWGYRKSTLCKPYPWGWKPEQSLAGIFILTPECVDRFNLEGDERNLMVEVGQQYGYDQNYNRTDEAIEVYRDAQFRRVDRPLVFEKEFEWADISTLDVGEESNQTCMYGARLCKYPPRQEDYDLWGRKQSNDIPIFRYADILLTKAECLLRGAKATKGDTPASLMNVVRDCASAPHVTGTPTLQDLLDERSREFIEEPWRRNDLIRFGQFEQNKGWKYESSPATMTDVHKRLFPLPTGEMSTNTNWQQNPSY